MNCQPLCDVPFLLCSMKPNLKYKEVNEVRMKKTDKWLSNTPCSMDESVYILYFRDFLEDIKSSHPCVYVGGEGDSRGE